MGRGEGHACAARAVAVRRELALRAACSGMSPWGLGACASHPNSLVYLILVDCIASRGHDQLWREGGVHDGVTWQEEAWRGVLGGGGKS
jgi:hypothetical protein